MAYNATYVASDAPVAVVDVVVTVLAMFATFAGLLALVLLYNWCRGKKARGF